MASHVKKGDKVVVLAGDDKGKTGEVLRMYPDKKKVLVQGVNMVTKNLRKTQQNPQGGQIKKEMPIHMSNVLPVDPSTGQATRVTFKVNEDGSKERVAKKSGESLGVVTHAK